MQVFVYEYLCGGALAFQSGAASLRTEGWAMLRAILEDLGRCPDVRVVTLLAPGLDVGGFVFPENLSVQSLRPGAEEAAFRKLAEQADFSLVIAPASDDLLYQRCRWVEEEKGHLLGPCAEAVQLTGDKLKLAEHLGARGVPTPPSVILVPGDGLGTLRPPFVCKPRYGAGSQATFLVRTLQDLSRCEIEASAEGCTGEMIVQPYVSGLSASVAFLAGPGRLVALPATEQRLTTDGRFRYRGGRLPLSSDLDRRARTLAERAVRQVEGMHGYFGVDLVLGAADDGSEDAVIEINPRLTTSYIGLRVLADFNLAEALLATATGKPLPAWQWRAGGVEFTSDGNDEQIVLSGRPLASVVTICYSDAR
jgi:predicted ATP-grasp superfamily ATP-dependent carboligase